MRKRFSLSFAALLASLTLIGSAYAQNSPGPVAASGHGTSATSSLITTNQSPLSSLSTLPDTDTIIYINPQRILSDVMPKLMSPKDLEGMTKGFEEVKKNFGVDPTHVEYIVVAVRFKKPTADLKFQPPEALIVASGDFSAEALIGLARMASQGQLRDEKYGARTLGLMTIEPMVKEAEKNPFLKSFTEVGIVALNGNTIAVGTPAYLRAAIDAGEGKDRISTETLNSLVRDPNALISVAGRPWHSFARSFGMLGTEAADRTPRCDTRIGDFYAALTMDATNFMVRGTVNEDNPDTAKIVSNLFSGLLGYAGSSLNDPGAQSMLKNLTFAAEGDDVIIHADFPQQMIINLVQQQMMKPKAHEVTAPQTPARRVRARVRVRRRT